MTTEQEFYKMIEKKQMNWLNIYNNPDIINAYGGYSSGVPMLFLIDKKGNIVYFKGGAITTGDINLNNLKKILQNENLWL